MELSERIKQTVRDVNDFPKEGIVFKDISTILLNSELCIDIVAHLAEKHRNSNLQAIAGIESRGFLFGFPLAMSLGIPFILIRKKGKLPYNKVSYAYNLEYGSTEIEMHSDAIKHGDRILIHDDLLATGGSAAAAAELVHKCGGTVAGFDFLVELSFLNGVNALTSYNTPVYSLVQY